MMLTSLIILALLALAAPVLQRLSPRFASLAIPAVPFGLGLWYAASLPTVAAGEALRETVAWAPMLGLDLGFRLDGLSLTFAMLITLIGSGVLLYASAYLRDDERLGTFYGILIGFMAAMLGLVLADNLILIFVFWELTSITSFLLIGYEYRRESARKAALQALLTTGIGGLALLAGLVLLAIIGGASVPGAIAGTAGAPGAPIFDLSRLLEAAGQGWRASEHGLYPAAVVLILLGCFTKSAMLPFHYWLPNAMEAPTPVSALLHSSTMVKAGVYLIARLHPVMGGSLIWDDVLIVFGAATMLVAAFLATRQQALKKILAYSTVSSLGALVMLIGMGAAKAAAVYLIAHAMFKAALFLIAGTMTKQTGGVKYIDRLGGLASVMPITAISGLLAGLSFAGMFPLMGFVGKELLLKAGLAHPEFALLVTIITTLAGLLTVTAAAMVVLRPLFLPPAADLDEPVGAEGEPSWRMLAAPAVLALLGAVAGIAPGLFAQPMVESVIIAISGTAYGEPLKLAFWQLLWPVTTATVLSIVAIVGGAALFAVRPGYLRLTAWEDRVSAVGPERWYGWTLAGTLAFADRLTRVLQNGNLRYYVRFTLLAACGLVLAVLLPGLASGVGLPNVLDDAGPLDLTLIVLIIAAAVVVTRLRSRLGAIATLGVIGYSVALLFAFYGAPDLAMTQFAVETLIVIIFVLVIYHLPRFKQLTSGGRRAWDALVACFFGATMTLLVLTSMSSRTTLPPVSVEHAARSAPEAYGRNVVNVILVDFRALDTLGEIFVLGLAAVGVYTLLRLRAGQATPPPMLPSTPTNPNPMNDRAGGSRANTSSDGRAEPEVDEAFETPDPREARDRDQSFAAQRREEAPS